MKLYLFYVVLGTLLLFQVEAVKKKLIKKVKVCKRNTPDIAKCYCDNFSRILPLLKSGQPTMGIPPLDPIKVDFIKMELPASNSIHFNASLYNIVLHGLSKGRAIECEAYITENGIQLFFDLYFPKIELMSNYTGSGKLLLLAIESEGDFDAECIDMRTSSIWNSTKFMKNGRVYLKFTVSNMNMEMKTMKIHFNNLFGNNTELNDNINEAINSNISLLYEEIKPVMLEAVKAIFLNVINNFYDLFPYDVLYPVE